MTNYGFVPPTIEEDNFILGGVFSLPKIVINPSGDWGAYLPEYEPQSSAKYDTHGCTVWGTLNALETLFKQQGKWFNFSDRFTYIMAGVRPPGSDPHKISQAIRHHGVIHQEDLPFMETFEEFIKPDPMKATHLVEGQKWLLRHSLGHEYVFKGNMQKDKMIECLRYSPLGISVTAWRKNAVGEYSSDGVANNHWCMCYKIDAIGRPHVFDSYDSSIKILSVDHEIKYCKRYYLSENKPQKDNWVINMLKALLKFIGL